MPLSYKITDLPPVWPGKRTAFKKKAPFKSQHTRTMAALERELKHLGARQVELALELSRGAFDLRQDGLLRADARPKPAVILSFVDRDGQRQAYPCDTYGWWEDNLHAIAVVLEDLRRAERYGVQSALLRAGFKALPSQATTTMNAQQAAMLLSGHSTVEHGVILTDKEAARSAIRTAVFRTHPDRNNGERGNFDLVDSARQVLSAHHGVNL